MVIIGTPYTGTQPGNISVDLLPQVGDGGVVGTPPSPPSPTPQTPCEPTCPPPDCAWIFDRLVVSPSIQYGSRVDWIIHPQFRGPQPFTFQLQVGRTANPAADDWENVGPPVEDGTYAYDDQKRLWAAAKWLHYRVKLTTADNQTYFSSPLQASGGLSRSDWLKWKNHIRMWTISLRKSPGGAQGSLLKRRVYGTPCDCLDPQTGEVRKPQHELCYGTGWIGGYFPEMDCVYADMGLASDNAKTNMEGRYMTADNSVSARMLGVPQLFEKDVFVERGSDVRYAIRGIQYLVSQTGMPVAANVKLVPYPFDHVIYKFPLGG